MSISFVTKKYVLEEKLDNSTEDIKESETLKLSPLLSPETKVKAVEKKALNLGWTKDQLWKVPANVRNYKEKGLICSIKTNTTIGEVTAKFIEIVIKTTNRSVVQKFYNLNVDQSWLKHL